MVSLTLLLNVSIESSAATGDILQYTYDNAYFVSKQFIPPDSGSGQFSQSYSKSYTISPTVTDRIYQIGIAFNYSLTSTSYDTILHPENYQFYVLLNGIKYYVSPGVCTWITVSGFSTDVITFGFDGTYTVLDTFIYDSYVSASFVTNITDMTIVLIDRGVISDASVVGSIQQGNSLQQQGNQLQSEGNQLQQEENRLQQEQNQTTSNIFSSIADFFGSFFENIINALKGLFVPEDGYFEDFFNRLNNFFSEKLGALYAPIDIFIDVLTGIMNADGIDAGIRFPGVAWEGMYIIEPQTVSLSSYAAEFPDLQEKIYFVTDVMMVGAVLLLLQNKLKGVMSN